MDVGGARIGVALSDPSGLLASPLGAIDRVSEDEDIDAVVRLATQKEASEIVVGLPLSLSGDEGPQARLVSRFAKRLAARADVPVKTHDERYSTVEAERLLRETGRQPSKDRARVDAAAAAVVLQSYLDSARAREDTGGADRR